MKLPVCNECKKTIHKKHLRYNIGGVEKEHLIHIGCLNKYTKELLTLREEMKNFTNNY